MNLIHKIPAMCTTFFTALVSDLFFFHHLIFAHLRFCKAKMHWRWSNPATMQQCDPFPMCTVTSPSRCGLRQVYPVSLNTTSKSMDQNVCKAGVKSSEKCERIGVPSDGLTEDRWNNDNLGGVETLNPYGSSDSCLICRYTCGTKHH